MLPTFFHQTPFFRLLLPFVAGILVGFRFSVPAVYCIVVCVVCIVASGFLLWKWKRRWGWLHGTFLNVFFFAVGICSVSLRTFVPNEETEHGTWLVVVDEPPVERANSIRATVRIRANLATEPETACNELVMTYFRKDSMARLLKQGDLIVMETMLRPVTNAGNPYEFDYRRHLERRRISRSAFVESGRWQKFDEYAQTPLFNFSNRIRNNLLDVLRRAGLSGNELSVVSSLTLGYRAELDDELRRAYSTSGAMHILAVSGLHVGIVYMVLNTFLMLFPFLNRAKWLKALIQLSALWLFALITGLSPSVMRAATMFSFIAAGNALFLRGYVYNSIAASAFILLLANPNNLLSVSFQFSYSAVIFIVFLHPLLYRSITFKNKFLDKVWDLTCVSIAAQTGVAPLAMFYFKQFPSYFIFTNYIVIPAASVIIYGAVLLFVVSPIPVLLQTFGWLLDRFMYAVNSSIFFIEKLPGSLIAEIRFAGWEIFFAYVLIVGIGALALTKRKTALFTVLVVMALWVTGSTIRADNDFQRQKLIVYHSNGNSILQFVNGSDNAVWYAGRNPAFNVPGFLNNQRTAMQLNAGQYHHLDSTQTQQPPWLFTDGNFVQFAGKRLAIFTRDMPPQIAAEQPIKTDIAILTQNVNIRITQIIESYNPDLIVVDASNSRARADRWEIESEEAGIKFHRVDRDGAFVLRN